MLNSYSSMSLNDAEKQIDNELLAYEIFSRLENLAQTDNEELIENYTYEILMSIERVIRMRIKRLLK